MIVLVLLIDLYAFAVFARLVLSWATVPATGAVASALRGIYVITEPPLAAIRSVVRPVRLGSTTLDLAPLLLLVGLWLLSSVIFR